MDVGSYLVLLAATVIDLYSVDCYWYDLVLGLLVEPVPVSVSGAGLSSLFSSHVSGLLLSLVDGGLFVGMMYRCWVYAWISGCRGLRSGSARRGG